MSDKSVSIMLILLVVSQATYLGWMVYKDLDESFIITVGDNIEYQCRQVK